MNDTTRSFPMTVSVTVEWSRDDGERCGGIHRCRALMMNREIGSQSMAELVHDTRAAPYFLPSGSDRLA